MKHKNVFLLLSLLAVIVTLAYSCEKDEDTNDDHNNNQNPPKVTYKDTIHDVDNNSYKTVMIGEQEWMAKNLKTTTYNDGAPISMVSNKTDWQNATYGAYCWYDNDGTYKNKFGALYNWHAVNSGNLCPAGWHVPTDAEWQQMIDYVSANGYPDSAAVALKADTIWINNGRGDDKFLFSALPAGSRSEYGDYSGIEWSGRWWSSTEKANDLAWQFNITSYDKEVLRAYFHKPLGMSVRCVKD